MEAGLSLCAKSLTVVAMYERHSGMQQDAATARDTPILSA